jgi:O-antigen ligase
VKLARLFLFLFVVFLFVQVRLEGVTLYKISGAILAGLVVLLLRRARFSRSPIDGYLFAVIVISIAGLIGAIGSGYGYTTDLAKTFLNILLYFSAAFVGTRLREHQMILRAVVVGGLVVLVTGLADFSQGVGISRVGGVLVNPNAFGLASLEVMICTVALIAATRSWVWRLLLIGIIPFSIFGLFYSGSRAAFIALLGSLFVFAYLGSTRRLAWFTALFLAFAMALWAPESFFERWESAFRTDKPQRASAIDVRMTLARNGLIMFKERPFFGIGPGNARYGMKDQFSISLVTHNTFVQALVETGAVGGIAFCGLVLVTGRSMLRVARRRGQSRALRGVTSGYLAWLAAECVFGLSHGSFLLPQWYLLIAVGRNLQLVVERPDGREQEGEEDEPGDASGSGDEAALRGPQGWGTDVSFRAGELCQRSNPYCDGRLAFSDRLSQGEEGENGR